MLTPEDAKRRDEWLERMKDRPFKNMTYCGREVTIGDVERWLRDAVDAQTNACGNEPAHE